MIFLPLNLIASIGGMSEYTSLTRNLPWPLSYGLLILAMAGIGTGLLLVLTRKRQKDK